MKQPHEMVKPRGSLFRRIALERYRAPLESNVPWILIPWRTQPLWLAAMLVLAVCVAWLA